MARGFLRPAPYGRIAVEIDSAGDAAPSAAVVSNLTNTLGRESGKPVSQQGGHAFAGKGNGCWSDQEVLASSRSQRRTHTSSGTAALFVMFLDGASCSSADYLGFAYGSTSMVIFTDRIRSLATPTVSADQFMKSVTTHELGHILGLVNIGYQSNINHEDGAHPHHSSNQASVMYWAIDQRNLVQQFVSGPPQNYDSNDEADLQGLRNGTY